MPEQKYGRTETNTRRKESRCEKVKDDNSDKKNKPQLNQFMCIKHLLACFSWTPVEGSVVVAAAAVTAAPCSLWMNLSLSLSSPHPPSFPFSCLAAGRKSLNTFLFPLIIYEQRVQRWDLVPLSRLRSGQFSLHPFLKFKQLHLCLDGAWISFSDQFICRRGGLRQPSLVLSVFSDICSVLFSVPPFKSLISSAVRRSFFFTIFHVRQSLCKVGREAVKGVAQRIYSEGERGENRPHSSALSTEPYIKHLYMQAAFSGTIDTLGGL